MMFYNVKVKSHSKVMILCKLKKSFCEKRGKNHTVHGSIIRAWVKMLKISSLQKQKVRNRIHMMFPMST